LKNPYRVLAYLQHVTVTSTRSFGRQGSVRMTFTSLLIALTLFGCQRKEVVEQPEVVVYTALDQEFSKLIFATFTEKTRIAVRAKYDAESTKTVQLTEAIIQERARPRCDLFWNNEILNTFRLERAGLLRPYKSPAAEAYPASAHSPNGMWYGFAARARVLIVNKNHRHPKSIRDLTDPQWYDRCGIAKPLFGTTATHAACLFAAWGDAKAEDFFRNVKRNARIMSGNRQVAEAVSANQLSFGLTDTDDAIGEIAKGMPVEIVYPDQGDAEIGTLFIPNTLALIKDSPHPKDAEKLLDYLLSANVERKLAEGPSAQIPLQPNIEASKRVKTPAQVRAMEVDWSAAAAKWDTAAHFLQSEFTGAD
jgi:iron(III) transport system substrate-binding protein